MTIDFTKNKPPIYYHLLKLACISQSMSISRPDFVCQVNQLAQYAQAHHRIIALIYAKAIALQAFDLLEHNVQLLLKTKAQQLAITQLAQTQQIHSIVKLLSAHNISVILLKGAAFSNLIYTNNAPRGSNDLDILVQHKDWSLAVKLISEQMNFCPKASPDVFGDLYELSFTPRQGAGCALDMHRSLMQPYIFNINQQALWEESVIHPEFNDKNIKILSPEHALIHQAIHAYKDMDFSKYNLVDSHEIICQLKPDLAKTIDISVQWGLSVPLYVLLVNCHAILDTRVEQHFLDRIMPNVVTQFWIHKLLKSANRQPINHKKTIAYRFNQVQSQFLFSNSIKRPLTLQWLFAKSWLSQWTKNKRMD